MRRMLQKWSGVNPKPNPNPNAQNTSEMEWSNAELSTDKSSIECSHVQNTQTRRTIEAQNRTAQSPVINTW